ncbi:MAG: helix-turn-helix domain-containing protein, partial [Burkholderiales bacterium]
SMPSSVKQRALDLVRAGQSAAAAAREVGVSRQAVHQWVAAWEAEHGEQLLPKRLSPEARGGAPLPEDPQERAQELTRRRKVAERERRHEAGLVRFEAWVHPEDRAALTAYVARLTKRRGVG